MTQWKKPRKEQNNMLSNFWINKRRERELSKYAKEIAAHFKMNVSDLLRRELPDRYVLLEKFLKLKAKKGK